jgi:hypothetical protein
MEVKNQAIEAFMKTEAMMRASPAVRDWFFALLTRGESASITRESPAKTKARRSSKRLE